MTEIKPIYISPYKFKHSTEESLTQSKTNKIKSDFRSKFDNKIKFLTLLDK